MYMSLLGLRCRHWTGCVCTTRAPTSSPVIPTVCVHVCGCSPCFSCSEADRRAARNMRLMQAATAADVLAEEQEALRLLQMQADAAVLDAAQQQQQQSQRRLSSPTQSPRLKAGSPRLPPVPPAAAPAVVQQKLTPRQGASSTPEPGQHHHIHGLDASSSASHSKTPVPSRPPVAPASSSSRPQSAASSPAGSCRASPEPCAHEQQGLHAARGCCSVTPLDLGRASSTGVVSVLASPREAGAEKLCAESSCGSVSARHAQQQPPWCPTSCSPPPRLQASSGSCVRLGSAGGGGGVVSSAGRTNVLYAVMALLGELDASGLSIVQREVQTRMMELQ